VSYLVIKEVLTLQSLMCELETLLDGSFSDVPFDVSLSIKFDGVFNTGEMSKVWKGKEKNAI
jgi:hypothetical protein